MGESLLFSHKSLLMEVPPPPWLIDSVYVFHWGFDRVQVSDLLYSLSQVTAVVLLVGKGEVVSYGSVRELGADVEPGLPNPLWGGCHYRWGSRRDGVSFSEVHLVLLPGLHPARDW